jgi:hypothetical protein
MELEAAKPEIICLGRFLLYLQCPGRVWALPGVWLLEQ